MPSDEELLPTDEQFAEAMKTVDRFLTYARGERTRLERLASKPMRVAKDVIGITKIRPPKVWISNELRIDDRYILISREQFERLYHTACIATGKSREHDSQNSARLLAEEIREFESDR